jgi:hypothetical protein
MGKFVTTLEEIKDISSKRDALIKKGAEEFKEYIVEFTKSLKDDGLVGIRWVHYTPAFNDGDSCEFTVGEVYAKFSDSSEEEDEEGGYIGEGGYIDTYCIHDDKSKQSVIEKIKVMFRYIPEELLEQAFNNFVMITVTENGIDVRDYDRGD